MAIYRLLGAAAAFAVMTAPAMTQQVMGEPGYCAFYYPNANCQNRGPGNPYTGDAWLRLNQGNSVPERQSTRSHGEDRCSNGVCRFHRHANEPSWLPAELAATGLTLH